MNNKDYKLNIDYKYTKLYSNYLGYGNPESKIWFIGNEQALSELDNGIKETPLEKISNSSLENIDSYEYRDINGDFFSQKLIYINKKYEYFYERMGKASKTSINNLFITDLYFLPCEKGNMIGKTYLNEEMGRKKFYETNTEIYNLLKNRIKHLFSLLNNTTKKQVYIYSFSDYYVNYNFELIKKIIEYDFNKEEINIEGDNTYKLNYEGNIIYITKLIKNGLIK